jgi:S1-C subfamily serine protease
VNKTRFFLIAGIGCSILVLLLVVVGGLLFAVPLQFRIGRVAEATDESPTWTPIPGLKETQEAIPPLTLPPQGTQITPPAGSPQAIPEIESHVLTSLYEQLNPGVVNIQVYIQRGELIGQGAGSGFVLDKEGYIITNNHVVAEANQVTAVFYNGIEAEARVTGTDADSDLAVIQVDELPEGVHPLTVGDSDQVRVGEYVIAIGNPFGLGSSMTIGIVSAVGRMIPTGVTPFAIPQAIQTDAAINPGNSGGPLLNLKGEVIGVNAQIATGGTQANAGVGFAIPANIVRRVAPVLIESGSYQWPWLGVEGTSVNLVIMKANNLRTQQGAYIDRVIPDGPAAEAGLQGSSGTKQVDGFDIAVGGDVVIEADGKPVADFSDLLVDIAFKNPGDVIELTILRDGQRQWVTVELAARPSGFSP